MTEAVILSTFADVMQITLWVFTSISGLITVRPDGTIGNVNENFSKFMCGYSASELIGKVRLSVCLLPLQKKGRSLGEVK